MASKKSPTVTKLTERAAKDAAAMEAARATISELMPLALEMLGTSPGSSGSSGSQTISLPVAGYQTVLSALKTRPNWYVVSRQQIDRLARLLVERNWFARSVHEMRLGVYTHGFRFKSKEANDWAAKGVRGRNPFAVWQKDMVEEWLISRSIIVWWSKLAESGALPVLNIANAGDVEFEVVAGMEQITLTMPRLKLKPEEKARLGDRLFEAYSKGKKLVIREDDEEFAFRVMKGGKSTGPLQVSPLVSILDDLDFVEAIRIGDWHGAKARWEIIRHTKKGYGVSSGPNAGTTRGNAKAAELRAIVKAMKEILGKTDIATNYDQEIGYVTFPKEHFHSDLLADCKQRLLQWSGVFGVLLLKTDSQITGLSEFMMHMLRTEVLSFRAEFSNFLCSIFTDESFAGGVPGGLVLDPIWSVKPLYSAKAFNEMIVTCHTYGISSPQSLRELFDMDPDEESARMLEAHNEPKRYTPPFEPRQGISAGLVAPQESSGGNQLQQTIPGEPGRPAAE